MNYKITIFLMILISLFGCNNSQIGISNIQVGDADDEIQGFIGQDLHFKINTYFPDGIKHLEVTFVPLKETDWSFVKDYSAHVKEQNQYRLDGVIPIPADLAVGIYKLRVKAVSESGKRAEKVTEIQMKVDRTMPFASKIDISLNAKRDNLHLESEISAPKKIKKVKVTLKWDSSSKTYVFDKGEMIDAIQHTFHEHIDLNGFEDGKYNIILKVEDKEGRYFETKGDFIK